MTEPTPEQQQPNDIDEVDEMAHQAAAFFCIAAAREHKGLFCDIEEIDLPPYYAVKLELPLQSEYSSDSVEETAENIQTMLYFAKDVLIRYHIVRDDQEG